MSDPDQGKVFAEFVARELERERERRANFDSRGAAVVTTSGSLTTLLAAVGAFVSSRPGFRLPSNAVGPLTLTLLTFAVAAACGIAVTGGRIYRLASQKQMDEMLDPRWSSSEVEARNFVARLDVLTIVSLREGNNRKSAWLQWALGAQFFGLLLLTLSVYLILNAAT